MISSSTIFIVFVSTSCLLLYNGAESNIAKRSDDPPALEAVVMQLSAKVANLEARLTSDESLLARHAAFMVQFSTVEVQLAGAASLKFDNVIFNDGNAYDPMTGMFAAPFNGVYSFAFQIFSHAAERMVADLMVNGKIVSRMAVKTAGGGLDYEESEVTVVTAKLTKGDRVWVFNATPGISVIGVHHTFFTGSLLYATP